MRPAAKAPTSRVARTMPRSGSTFTSANTAPCACIAYCVASAGSAAPFPSPTISATPARRHDLGVAFAARLVVAPREPPVARDHAGVAGAVERRLRVVGREFGELGDGVAAGVVQRDAGGRGMAGAARDAPRRADPTCRSETRPCRAAAPSASAAICASAVQAPCPMSCPVASITPVPSAFSIARAAPWNISAGKVATPTPQPTSSPSSSRIWRGCSGRPAQPNRRRALGKTFAQRLRGERLAGDRLGLGVIQQAELERVHAARVRHFVDRAFERDRSRRLARRAHEQRRARVEPHRLVGRADRGLA